MCIQQSHEGALLLPLQLKGAERGPGRFWSPSTGWPLKGPSVQKPARPGKPLGICELAFWIAECTSWGFGKGRWYLFSVWHMFMTVFQAERMTWDDMGQGAQDRRWVLPSDSSATEDSHKQVACHKGAQGAESWSGPSLSTREE